MFVSAKKTSLLLVIALLSALLMGCADSSDPAVSGNETTNPNGNGMELTVVPEADGQSYEIPTSEASGVLVQSNELALIDSSNTDPGYIMAKYTGTNPKVKIQITGPSQETYTYNMRLDGQYDVLPLSDGSGDYFVRICENIEGTSYSAALSLNFSSSIEDEFAVFLRPNKYVDFTPESHVVAKAKELTKGETDMLEKVGSVYDYVVDNFTYDYDLAESVQSGYIPDVDAVLASNKGICFDYAAVITSMLRGLGIPTKLIVGNAGSAYHAWISVYSEEDGWINASIYFDGKEWKRMDPTFASNRKSSAEVLAYIGNGANYSAKFSY